MEDYFPALQQISDDCLGKPEKFNGGVTPIGEFFLASLGAPGLLPEGGNRTVGTDDGASAATRGVTA